MVRKPVLVSVGILIILIVGIFPQSIIERKDQITEENRILDRPIAPRDDVSYITYYDLMISGNGALAYYASSGYGNSTHPYIIQNYHFLPSYIDMGIYSYNPALRVDSCTAYFILRDCIIECNGYFEASWFTNVQNGIIENCEIRGGKHGIWFRGCTNIIVRGSEFINSVHSGIRVQNSVVNITGNSFSNIVYNSIWLERCTKAIVYSNNIIGTQGCGIFVDGRYFTSGAPDYPFQGASRYHNISYNTITGTQHGIIVYGEGWETDYNRITYNTMNMMTSSGISLWGTFADNNTIEHNLIVNGTGQYGIFLENGTDSNTVNDNIIQNSMGYGIFVNDSCYENEFRDNTIVNCTAAGFYLSDTGENDIIHNTITNSSTYGVRIQKSGYNNTVANNTISLCHYDGILLTGSTFDVIIRNNEIYENENNGIRVTGASYNNTLDLNTITNNGDYNESGILLENGASDNLIIGNTLSGSYNGIEVNSSDSNTITNNSVFNNNVGLCLDGAYENEFYFNYLFDPSFDNHNDLGIHIFGRSHDNIFQNNSIGGSSSYALSIEDLSSSNTLKFNYYIENNIAGTSQGFVSSSGNIIEYNYWWDWTTPDSEPDGIVDFPYMFDGGSYNDPYPLAIEVDLMEYHYLSDFTVTSPNGGEVVNDTTTIVWTASLDFWSHDVEYEIYYSIDNGETWVLIVTGLTVLEYDWDTTDVPKSVNSLIMVRAYCVEDSSVINEDTSDSIFELQGHSLVIPTLISPNGGEEIIGEVLINWTESSDSWEHTIQYSLFYSSNGGTSWIEIETELTDTDYTWDTTPILRGTEYLIKVVVSCSEGLTAEDTSDSTFIIEKEHTMTYPTVLSPNGGEIVNGSILIQWTAATDQREHDISYLVYYSHNSGTSWTIIISNLVVNEYLWNTTLLLEGSTYLIRVVANCSEGLMSEDTSDSVFTIRSHRLSAITIFLPTEGAKLNASTSIYWSTCIDSWEHEVNYAVYYSANGGDEWIEIVSGLTATNYVWDSSGLEVGTTYAIKVVASCEGDLTSEAVAEPFIVTEETTTSTTTTTTTITDTTTTTGTGTTTVIDTGIMMILVIAGIIGSIAVVIIIIIMKKRTAA